MEEQAGAGEMVILPAYQQETEYKNVLLVIQLIGQISRVLAVALGQIKSQVVVTVVEMAVQMAGMVVLAQPMLLRVVRVEHTGVGGVEMLRPPVTLPQMHRIMAAAAAGRPLITIAVS